MTEEIHDTSHLDRYLQTRQRVSLLNAIWRPMAAGAAGAALVIAAASVVLPRITYRDIEVPRITLRDVTVPNIITKDLEIPIPRVVAPPPPVAANPPSPPSDAPRTPEEQKFHDRPEYKDAAYHGRIVTSRDGHVLSFADGRDFHPAHWDDAAGKVVYDPDQVITSDEYVGDLGMCVPHKGHEGMWDCTAVHNGKATFVSGDDSGRPVEPQPPIDSTPTRSATATVDMINVDIDVGDYPVSAQVDTGCSWPLSLPKDLADILVKRGLAIRAGSSETTFADGITHDVDIILIKTITVDGRVLHDVEASVVSRDATVLPGLGALNRLGPFKIENGAIVFERPT
jgi:hypothetical protein